MSLRAYIYLSINKADTNVRKRGDVISVHLSKRRKPRKNSPTHREFIIVENWEDNDLEADMIAKGQDMRAYPYAEYSEIDLGNGRIQRNMTKRSKIFINPSLISFELRRRLLNRNEAVDPVDYSQIRLAKRNRS